MGKKTSRVYNPKTGKWEIKTYTSTTKTSAKKSNKSSNTDTKKSTKTASTDPNSSQGKAEKKYVEKQLNTLEGSLTLIPNKKTLFINVGDTIRINGIGAYLSGKYFVKDKQLTIDSSSGMSNINLTVIKTGFGDSIKSGKNDPTPKTKFKVVIKKGHKVKINSSKATYADRDCGKIPKTVKKKSYKVLAMNDNKKSALLSDINRWVYTAYLKKV